MKNSTKRPLWLWLFLCLPMVFIAYFAIVLAEGNINPDSVSSITVTTPLGENFVFESGDSIPFYVDMYLEADKLSKPIRDVENEKPLTVSISQKNIVTSFDLYAEVNTNGCFLRNSEGEYLSIPSSFAKQLLQREECYYVYGKAGHTLPTLLFKSEDAEQKVLPKDYSWQFKDIAGTAVIDAQTEKETARQFFSFLGEKGFTLSFAKEPSEYTITFYDQSGNACDISDPSSLIFPTDTQLRAVVAAKWGKSDTALGGSATYDFDLLYDVLPEIIRSKDTVNAGDILSIEFRHFSKSEAITLSTLLETSEIKVNYSPDGTAFALIPISSDNQAGEYTLVFNIGDFEKTLTVNVEAIDPVFTTATMDTEKHTYFLINDYQTTFNSFLNSIKDGTTEAMISHGNSFSKPTEGSVMYEYGTELLINGAPNSYIVNGIDYRLEDGNSVKSTQRGVVIYSGVDDVYGNIIIIDHGYGIRSHYYGLGTLGKSVGDTVQEGEIIGTAGVSGLVYTEDSVKIPTLHFAISVNGIFVNPTPLFKSGIDIAM